MPARIRVPGTLWAFLDRIFAAVIAVAIFLVRFVVSDFRCIFEVAVNNIVVGRRTRGFSAKSTFRAEKN